MVTSLMTLAHSLGLERAAIFHVDDVGMCRGSNRGFLDLAEKGFVTCGSAMMPCPGFERSPRRQQPTRLLDLRVHLTLTGEWKPISFISRERQSGATGKP
jgi:hypothetical protein